MIKAVPVLPTINITSTDCVRWTQTLNVILIDMHLDFADMTGILTGIDFDLHPSDRIDIDLHPSDISDTTLIPHLIDMWIIDISPTLNIL